jgi:putative heme-binding domain-containing protein
MRRFAFSVVAGLVVPVLVVVAAARVIQVAETGFTLTSFDTREGRRIFSNRCVRCHAMGGMDAVGGDIAPDLSQIGAIAPQRKPGYSAADYILESILKPNEFKSPGSSGEMPSNLAEGLSDDAVRNLVAYLCASGGGVKDDEIRRLSIDRPPVAAEEQVIARDQILRGEAVFRGKGLCASCHPYYAGSDFENHAPVLFFRGYRSADEVRQAIVSPHAAVAARYRLSSVMLKSGEVLVGRVIQQTDKELVLLVHQGEMISGRRISLDDVERDDEGKLMVAESPVSSMPEGVNQLLTDGELDDLIAFILAAN